MGGGGGLISGEHISVIKKTLTHIVVAMETLLAPVSF